MALQSFFFDCVYLFHVESIKNPCISSRERSQTDKMVDGMDFEELCSDFECISSPYVESIMRQVARDISELREDNRAFSCYAVPVKYEVFLCYVKSFTFCTLIGSFRLLVWVLLDRYFTLDFALENLQAVTLCCHGYQFLCVFIIYVIWHFHDTYVEHLIGRFFLVSCNSPSSLIFFPGSFLMIIYNDKSRKLQ